MTRLRGIFLLTRACNSSTSRRLSELIFSLFILDSFFMIRRVIQEIKKIFFSMSQLDWLISYCIFNLIYNETAKFLDDPTSRCRERCCSLVIVDDSLVRWDPSACNWSRCRWGNPFPDFFCFFDMITNGVIMCLYLYLLLLNTRPCEWCLCLCAFIASTLVFVHIFHVEEIIGNSLENQLIKTCTSIRYAVFFILFFLFLLLLSRLETDAA